MGWQPIETAPQDGTLVLLYWPDHAEEDQINVGRWTGTTWHRGYATEPTMWAEIHRPGAPSHESGVSPTWEGGLTKAGKAAAEYLRANKGDRVMKAKPLTDPQRNFLLTASKSGWVSLSTGTDRTIAHRLVNRGLGEIRSDRWLGSRFYINGSGRSAISGVLQN